MNDKELSQELRDKITAGFYAEYAEERQINTHIRIIVAFLISVSLIFANANIWAVIIWFTAVTASQLIDRKSCKELLFDSFSKKNQNNLFYRNFLSALIYCSITFACWFGGSVWVKLCIMWLLVGSIATNVAAPHHLERLRIFMLSPYLITTPVILAIDILFAKDTSRIGLIAIFIMFLVGSIHFLNNLFKSYRNSLRFETLLMDLELEKLKAIKGSEAKSEFVSTISHELRNPLNAILGSATLLRQNLKSKENLELIDTLLDSGKGMISLLNEILDHAKIEAGKIEFDNMDFDPEVMAESCAKLWEGPILQKNLEFICDYHGQLPKALYGDAGRIGQIINNLLSNANKFTKIGWICLRIAYENNFLIIEVRDSGIGMDEEGVARLFKPFTQASVSTSTIYGGTGLGLTNCNKLAQLMGGNIQVESEAGKGTVFTVKLPMSIGDEKKIPRRKVEKIEFEDMGEKNLSVLAADDNPANRLIIGRFLEIVGAKVDLVDDGQLAIERANQNEYDIILLDVRMPNIDGLQACRTIRSASKLNSETPIIMISADASQSQIQIGYDAGADGYLPKPIDAGKLYQIISIASGGREAFSDAA